MILEGSNTVKLHDVATLYHGFIVQRFTLQMLFQYTQVQCC